MQILKYILIFAAACTITALIFILIRRPWRLTNRRERQREWLMCFFVIFMTGMFYMTFRGTYMRPGLMLKDALQRIHTGRDINLVPFRNISNMYLYDDREHFAMNILGNTLMFIPWGFFRPFLRKRQQKAVHVIAGALLLTVFIETVQLFIGRTVDIDDIILNFAGSLCGSGLYFLAAALFPRIKLYAE